MVDMLRADPVTLLLEALGPRLAKPPTIGEALFGTKQSEPTVPVPTPSQTPASAPAPVSRPAPASTPTAAPAELSPTAYEPFDLTQPPRLGPAGGTFSLSDPVMKIFLAQTGLNLLAGGGGDPLQNLGAAAGAGGEAVGRFTKGQRETALSNIETEQMQQKLDIARESARTKRLREKDPAALAVEGMDPTAQAYFRQRIKGLNVEDILDENSTPTARYDQLLNETRTIDARSRFSSGKMRAVEFPERDIAAATANPQMEAYLLSAVKASPAETAILQQRIERARAVGAKPTGKK